MSCSESIVIRQQNNVATSRLFRTSYNSGLLFSLIPCCRGAKLSRVDLLVKQTIQRLRRHILCLGQPKECPNKQTDVKNSCWKCSLAFEIPLPWVEHVWRDDDVDDGEKVVHVATERNCFVAKLDGADFSCDGVGNWADGYAWGRIR